MYLGNRPTVNEKQGMLKMQTNAAQFRVEKLIFVLIRTRA